VDGVLEHCVTRRRWRGWASHTNSNPLSHHCLTKLTQPFFRLLSLSTRRFAHCRIEIVSSNLAEELHAVKGEIQSLPSYAYLNAPAPRYAPLELRDVELDSVVSSLLGTPVSKRKADRDAEEDQAASRKKVRNTTGRSAERI
jgi:hypothetical protein